MRNPIHGFMFPLWPAADGTTTVLDAPRTALDSILDEFRGNVVAVYEDKFLSDLGRATKIEKLFKEIAPLIDNMASRIAPALAAVQVKADSLDAGPASVFDEMRHREIRDCLASLPTDIRYVAIETAIDASDTETLRAIVRCPAVRRSAIVDTQADRVRDTLWEALNARMASEIHLTREQAEVFATTLEMAKEQIRDLYASGAPGMKRFEEGRGYAGQYSDLLRDGARTHTVPVTSETSVS